MLAFFSQFLKRSQGVFADQALHDKVSISITVIPFSLSRCSERYSKKIWKIRDAALLPGSYFHESQTADSKRGYTVGHANA